MDFMYLQVLLSTPCVLFNTGINPRNTGKIPKTGGWAKRWMSLINNAHAHGWSTTFEL